jgi:hypothetical protein
MYTEVERNNRQGGITMNYKEAAKILRKMQSNNELIFRMAVATLWT